MHIKLRLLIFVIGNTLRAVTVAEKDQNTETEESLNFCFNSSLQGYRLNVAVLNTTVTTDWLACVMECVTEPCCRSINYKNTLNLQNEPNCEMLHNLVYDTSQELLEANSSYNHVYLNNPPKEYNENCFLKFPKHKINDVSEILKNEPTEFEKKLGEWLPRTGNWSICWRATRDGWAASTFHSNCDRKSPTITIVQVINNNKKYVFGGYATAPWNRRGGKKSAPGSFLFSLRNHDNLAPFKAPLKDENDEWALYHYSGLGPTFGKGRDLSIANDATSNAVSFTRFGYSYQPPSGYTTYQSNQTSALSLLAGSYHFTPSEIEVLYLNAKTTYTTPQDVSEILKNEPAEFEKQLREWLPKTGDWSICWRATRDGSTANTFHSRCEGKSPTLTIVQVIKNNKKFVFGGYATVPWHGGGGNYYQSAPGSFLFSLRNNDNIAPFKAPLKVENDAQAVYQGFGPTFGCCHDLYIASNATSNAYSFANFGFSYQAPPGYTQSETNTKSLIAGSYFFTPTEVEVLYLN